jgi:hypothetical protein
VSEVYIRRQHEKDNPVHYTKKNTSNVRSGKNPQRRFVRRIAFLAMKKEKKAEWGDKPCDHPRIIQERFLGMTTGAVACTTCGRAVTVDEKGNPIAN